jgi:cyclophilin family peptidyl-prolyl cis-trans isomerase
MKIIETLISWGINIQKEDNIFDFLTLNYPQQCFYIDRFPLLVENFEKYEKEELYYEKVINNEVSEEFFMIQESKFVNVMKKMWLYNEVLFQTELLEVPNDIKNGKQLDSLIKLAVRESAYSKMFFLDQKIIVIAYGMCFQVYLHDLSSLQFINTIVSTEGLYLRPY